MRIRDRNLILIFFLIDLLILNISIIIASFIHYGKFDVVDIFAEIILWNASWFLCFIPFINANLFTKHTLATRIKDNLKRSLIYIAISSFLLVMLNFDAISRWLYIESFVIFFTLRFFVSYFYSYLIKNKREGEHYGKILIIGTGKIAGSILSFYIKNPDRGHVVGFLSDEQRQFRKQNILGKIKDFNSVIKEHEINETIISLSSLENENVKNIINNAEFHGIRPRVVPDYFALFKRNYEIQKLGNVPLVNIREVKLDYYANRFWKRAFDLVFSLFGIVFAIPFFIITALIIKIDSRGPVFYRPIRQGKGGLEFKVYKFRTMKVSDDESSGIKSTQKDDPRITRFGKFLRKYSLDELPQLFNVLGNKMSIVGPRPHRIHLNKEFRKRIYTYNVRQYIRPGITGWAQVNGWRGPTDTKLDYYGRTLHDIWYIENWSFALDLYIIYLTIFGKKVRNNAF
jgi:Undecaprenyl-phosphate glucose phosphotransferase